MKRLRKKFLNYPLNRRMRILFAFLLFSMAMAGCSSDNPVAETESASEQALVKKNGALNVNVNPASAMVKITGPKKFSEEFPGNQLLSDLKPGQYTMKATAPGFTETTTAANVVANETSNISLFLQAQPIMENAASAVYRDGNGGLIPIESADVQSGQLVFYAWLEDEPLGIVPANIIANPSSDPGYPLISERDEYAPSFTQNLATAWVGFRDPTGNVRPVIGADVRWEIDQWWSGRINSTQFGTSDDNGIAHGYGITDDQADTRTNNGGLIAESFPLAVSEFPLNNVSGIGSPFTDGFTWVTLFSPDKIAASRVVAVATINGEEIGKQILYKNFTPSPKLEITKTVDQNLVNLVNGTATANWTVKVTNVGTGDATNVDLSDILSSGEGVNYTVGSLPAGSTPVGSDGFTYSFPLASTSTEPPSQTEQLLGDAQSFAVLANAAISGIGANVVNGNVGVSNGAMASGFPPGIVMNGTLQNNNPATTLAKVALATAYDDLEQRPCTGALNTPLDNAILTPGVYCYDSSVSLTEPLILDGQGDPNAEFVFNVTSSLTTAPGVSISLVNGASPCNVYWKVGSSAVVGSNSFFVGNILAQSDITAETNANISGRTLARDGAITLDTNAINAPLACVANPGNSITLNFTGTVTEPGTFCNEAQIDSYSNSSQTWNPINLNAEACFTAVESNVAIIKDFVASDNTTSLGQSLTVSPNVPATLRVRVVNSGSGNATGVLIDDVLSSGSASNYTLLSVSMGTPNGAGGFNTDIGDLPQGETATVLFTVAGSADGEYCDTATVSATSGVIGNSSDSACLTITSPELEIQKDNLPSTVFPGGSYTSTIVVNNIGTGTAKDVLISDLLGLNSTTGVYAIYVSSSLNGASGTLSNNVVTAPIAVDILAGESLTFSVVSRIPLGTIAGTFCDTGIAVSSNTMTKQAIECVEVPAFSALQTQLNDSEDPISVGSDVTFYSVLYVEALSNEGVSSNQMLYSFGLSSPTILGIPGEFEEVSTAVYLDTVPILDPITGQVVSGVSNPTAVLLSEGSDYTLDNSVLGLQRIIMEEGMVLQPDTALYVIHVVNVPFGTPVNHLYTTSYIWDSAGTVNPTHVYQASSSESTTVFQ